MLRKMIVVSALAGALNALLIPSRLIQSDCRV
jgi:hypothetical protein